MEHNHKHLRSAEIGTEHKGEVFDKRGSPTLKGEKAKELWTKDFKLASIPKSVDDATLKKLFSGLCFFLKI